MVEQRQTQMAINRMSGPVGRGPVPAAGIALTPKDIWGIVRRHILLIIFMTILGVIIGGISLVSFVEICSEIYRTGIYRSFAAHRKRPHKNRGRNSTKRTAI